MSRDENTPASPHPDPSRRRSSFTANKLSEMFNSARNPNSNNGSGGSPSNSPPPNSSVFPNPGAAARRLSITGALGLSGSNSSAASSGPNSATGTGPSGVWGLRRGSMTASYGSEESAIDESVETSDSVGPPPSPLGRRVSFGARAMGQMRQNDGFNWADNIRNRQSRSGSLGGALTSPSAARNEQMQAQQDKMPQPPKQASSVPPPPVKKERPAPDHFQERILKGDFYMD